MIQIVISPTCLLAALVFNSSLIEIPKRAQHLWMKPLWRNHKLHDSQKKKAIWHEHNLSQRAWQEYSTRIEDFHSWWQPGQRLLKVYFVSVKDLFFFSIWLGKAHDLKIFILLFFLMYYQYQTWWHLFESVNTCAKCKYDNKSMTAARSLMYGKVMAAIDLLILVLFYYCQFIPRLTCPTQKKKK